jgi:hypothetical protein
VTTKATVGHFIEKTVPTILGELRRDCTFGSTTIMREHDFQMKRLEVGHIHRDILNAALELIRFPHNFLSVREKITGGWIHTYYVNSNKGLYEPFTNSNRVTMERVKLYRKIVPDLSVEDFDMRYLSVYPVKVLHKDRRVPTSPVLSLRCQCPGYWNTGVLCSHIVAVAHDLGVVNVKHESSALMPVRGRGRPKRSEKALQRDLNPQLIEQQPGVWRGSFVRHTLYLTGCVVDYRHTPDDVVLWKCRFPDAPSKRKEFEFDKDQLHHALGLYRVWQEETRRIT